MHNKQNDDENNKPDDANTFDEEMRFLITTSIQTHLAFYY